MRLSIPVLYLRFTIASAILGILCCPNMRAQEPTSFSGIYPHLASFNKQGECGTGAVVPWADRLWWVTYSPHQPEGSDDKLMSMDSQMRMEIFADSVGGTPANRMIHRESNQLFIGPYVVDSQGKIRVISYKTMYGRPTANARHLTDPANKIYLATMEEGLYEIDVHSLDVKELWRDEQKKGGRHSDLPGYHGKGMYSGHGLIVYANNGEHGEAALKRPDVPSGCLASWNGTDEKWQIVSRRQFTEVTGPGGIYGNDNSSKDPIWSVGWDHRSLIVMWLDDKGWHEVRLPKASHSYDGAHGWNTEWPRIRDIGESNLLMTMHGMFWNFPKDFANGKIAGIRPRSTYLKVIGDFCRYGDRVVMGCDDAAKAEFLNTRKAKGKLPGPTESQSNLWFVAPQKLDSLGPVIGRGSVWLNDEVKSDEPSSAYLFAGFSKRSAQVFHDSDKPAKFTFETDANGDGQWKTALTVNVGPKETKFVPFESNLAGEWIRVRSSIACKATVWFEYRANDARPMTVQDKGAPTAESQINELTKGLALAGATESVQGLVRAGDREVGLQYLVRPRAKDSKEASESNAAKPIAYRLTPELKFVNDTDGERPGWLAKNLVLVRDALQLDGNSILYVEDDGTRYRLPISNMLYKSHPEWLADQRTSRETTTERDLFQCAGTFYELPARNAGGFARIRPIASHPYFIQDYCSWRGLLVLSGIDAKSNGPHIVRSDDGQAAVWLGAIDDLWQFGKPVGQGGPWTNSAVSAEKPSDPYLFCGFDRKDLRLQNHGKQSASVRAEIDITGMGQWQTYHRFQVAPGNDVVHTFPESLQGYWIRFVTEQDATITTELTYR